MLSALLRASLASKGADPLPLTLLLAPPPQMGWVEACTHPMACLRAWRGSSVLHPPQSGATGQPCPHAQLSNVLHVQSIALLLLSSLELLMLPLLLLLMLLLFCPDSGTVVPARMMRLMHWMCWECMF